MERTDNVTEDRIQLLREGFSSFPVKPTDRQLQQFLDYYDILTEWNQVMNLTAITDYEEVVAKHFVDSISLIQVTDLNREMKVIDIGTGAGFPGIPLKILFPELKITLLDSLNKRIRFLNEVIGKLELTDVEAIHGRAEDFARQKEYREQFDLCVSRAVANLSTLSEYCLPYVKEGGYFISYKSGDIEEEVKASGKALGILGGELEDVVKFSLPGTDIGRAFVKIRKIKDTGKKYHSTRIYKCRCDCGNTIEVNINKLHTGHVKSCGCRRFRWKDLTGQRFGRLEVLEVAYTKDNKNFWKCRCDCGNVCYVNTASLTNGTTVSCGCKNDENRASLSSFDRGLIDGTMKCAIKKDRKLNKNNSSGVRGVHYDKDRKLWVAQIMFQRKAHLLGRFKTKREAISARQVGEEKYFEKYR